MKSVAEKWRIVKANPGLYLASALFVVLLCMFSHRSLSAHFPEWEQHWWQQGIMCVTIALVYLFFPKPAAITTQVVFGVALVAVFCDNTWHQRAAPVWILIGTAASLLLYCFAEAFEIAFTQLRDKETDRFDPHNRVTVLLSKIKTQDVLFYEAREWLVIALVILLTLVSDFEHLTLAYPPYDFKEPWIRLAFSLLFTTVVVVWVAQSPGKSLARENPFLCMSYCGWLWRPLSFFGTLMKGAQMFEPAELLKNGLLKAMPQFRIKPDLRPSQEAYFNTAVKRYGYCLHALEDEIEIYSNGSALLFEVGLFYIVCGERTSFTRWYDFDAPIAARPDGSPDVSYDLEAFLVPGFKEEMDECVVSTLDSILDHDPNSHAIPAELGLRPRVEFGTTETPTGPVQNRKQVLLIIDAPDALPEKVAKPEQAVALRFDVVVATEKHAFKLPSPHLHGSRAKDYYFRIFTFPCLRTRVRLALEDPLSPVEFARIRPEASLLDSPHPLETGRIRLTRPSLKAIQFEVRYPVAGVKYQVAWEVWRD